MQTIVYAAIGYFFLLLIVRVMGRRPGGQLAPLEFVVVFLIGGVIILATVDDDRSSTNCFMAVIAVGLMHRMVATLKQKFPRFGALADGAPVVLIEDGKWDQESLRKSRLDEADVLGAARIKGVRTLTEIHYAILERNGGISIIKHPK